MHLRNTLADYIFKYALTLGFNVNEILDKLNDLTFDLSIHIFEELIFMMNSTEFKNMFVKY